MNVRMATYDGDLKREPPEKPVTSFIQGVSYLTYGGIPFERVELPEPAQVDQRALTAAYAAFLAPDELGLRDRLALAVCAYLDDVADRVCAEALAQPEEWA